VRPVRMLIGFAAAAVCLGLLGVSASADALSDEEGKLKVQPVIEMKAKAFSLEDVRLLDGPFKRAMELDRKYLLLLDVDRLLHNFRVNAGLPSSAEPLGAGKSQSVSCGDTRSGSYMTACALMYASTGDERLKEKAKPGGGRPGRVARTKSATAT